MYELGVPVLEMFGRRTPLLVLESFLVEVFGIQSAKLIHKLLEIETSCNKITAP